MGPTCSPADSYSRQTACIMSCMMASRHKSSLLEGRSFHNVRQQPARGLHALPSLGCMSSLQHCTAGGAHIMHFASCMRCAAAARPVRDSRAHDPSAVPWMMPMRGQHRDQLEHTWSAACDRWAAHACHSKTTAHIYKSASPQGVTSRACMRTPQREPSPAGFKATQPNRHSLEATFTLQGMRWTVGGSGEVMLDLSWQPGASALSVLVNPTFWVAWSMRQKSLLQQRC